MMELLRARLCWGAVTVWESAGWKHGRTLCAQAASQRLRMGGGHTRTAEGGLTLLSLMQSLSGTDWGLASSTGIWTAAGLSYAGFFSFSFLGRRSLHVHQSCQSQQYQQTNTGNL